MRDIKKRKPIEEAVQELKEHRKEIQCVNEWALYMGYSRSYFSRKVKGMFGRTPKRILADNKLEMIKEEIEKQPHAIGYTIAVNTGLEDEKALYKFLTTHFDTTLTDLRQGM